MFMWRATFFFFKPWSISKMNFVACVKIQQMTGPKKEEAKNPVFDIVIVLSSSSQGMAYKGEIKDILLL